VRDRNLQQNVVEYLTEAGHITPEVPWEVKRRAIWYWARIMIDIHPVQVLWWNSPEALDSAPESWDAPADTRYPQSDPTPAGQATPAPKWPQPQWQETAQQAISAEFPANLSLVDERGFPRIMRAHDVQLVDGGLTFELPRGVPGPRSGPASLTYFGRDTFVGQVSAERGRLRLAVERALPILPIVANPSNTWDPKPELKDPLMRRLAEEASRRGQAMPSVPEILPEPSKGARRRAKYDTQGADAALFEK
jgi:hypothetical protein